MSETAVQENVTFYCFNNDFGPVSQSIPVGGGRIFQDGRQIVVPSKIAKFSKLGKYTTADPEIIAALRKLARDPGTGITEDYELFLSKTLPQDKQIERLQRQIELQKDEKNRLIAQYKGK